MMTGRDAEAGSAESVDCSAGSILPLGTLDGFALGDRITNLITDANNSQFAATNGPNLINYAPKRSNLSGSSAALDLYKFKQPGFFNKVIGGLLTSTVLTLFVLPTLYAWFESPAARRGAAARR